MKLGDIDWHPITARVGEFRNLWADILVDLPHPTAEPSKPGKNGNPNSPCNKSGFLIVQEDPLHWIYWEKCGAAEL